MMAAFWNKDKTGREVFYSDQISLVVSAITIVTFLIVLFLFNLATLRSGIMYCYVSFLDQAANIINDLQCNAVLLTGSEVISLYA